MFQPQGAAMVFQLPHLLAPELPLPTEFAPLLFGHGGDTDGRKFVLLAVEITGQAQTELAGIQPVSFAPAFGIQADRTDDQVVGPGLDELIMEGVTEAAAFIDRPHRVAGLDFFPHPLHEAGGREAHGGLGMLMVTLDRGGDLFNIHVQTEFERGFHWGIALRLNL